MKETRILGVFITNRVKDAVKIQDILTKYGCSIKTRLGLHEAGTDFCSPSGLILLELTGDVNECISLENELLSIDHLQVQKMIFKN